MRHIFLKLLGAVLVILVLAGCAGMNHSTDYNYYDDGFYHYGMGRNDGAHSY